MRRREFITFIGGAAAWPLVARGQQPTMPMVGFLGNGSPTSDDGFRAAAVRQGLVEAGYVEGRNVTFDYRWAEDHNERLPALATELVRREVAVIVTAAVVLRPWRPSRQPELSRLSSPLVVIRSSWALSPVSTGPAEISPV